MGCEGKGGSGLGRPGDLEKIAWRMHHFSFLYDEAILAGSFGGQSFNHVHCDFPTLAFTKCLVNACCVSGNVQVSRKSEINHI